MYTVDEFIERLQELKAILPRGGKTPMVIESVDFDGYFEPAAAEIQNVVPHDVNEWRTLSNGNTEQVLRVF